MEVTFVTLMDQSLIMMHFHQSHRGHGNLNYDSRSRTLSDSRTRTIIFYWLVMNLTEQDWMLLLFTSSQILYHTFVIFVDWFSFKKRCTLMTQSFWFIFPAYRRTTGTIVIVLFQEAKFYQTNIDIDSSLMIPTNEMLLILVWMDAMHQQSTCLIIFLIDKIFLFWFIVVPVTSNTDDWLLVDTRRCLSNRWWMWTQLVENG